MKVTTRVKKETVTTHELTSHELYTAVIQFLEIDDDVSNVTIDYNERAETATVREVKVEEEVEDNG